MGSPGAEGLRAGTQGPEGKLVPGMKVPPQPPLLGLLMLGWAGQAEGQVRPRT